MQAEVKITFDAADESEAAKVRFAILAAVAAAGIEIEGVSSAMLEQEFIVHGVDLSEKRPFQARIRAQTRKAAVESVETDTKVVAKVEQPSDKRPVESRSTPAEEIK